MKNYAKIGIAKAKSYIMTRREKILKTKANKPLPHSQDIKNSVNAHPYYDKSNMKKINILANVPKEQWGCLNFIQNKHQILDMIQFVTIEMKAVEDNFKMYQIVNANFITNVLHLGRRHLPLEVVYDLYYTKLKYISILLQEMLGSIDETNNSTAGTNDTGSKNIASCSR